MLSNHIRRSLLVKRKLPRRTNDLEDLAVRIQRGSHYLLSKGSRRELASRTTKDAVGVSSLQLNDPSRIWDKSQARLMDLSELRNPIELEPYLGSESSLPASFDLLHGVEYASPRNLSPSTITLVARSTNLRGHGVLASGGSSRYHYYSYPNPSLSSMLGNHACSFSTQPQKETNDTAATDPRGDQSARTVPPVRISRTQVPTPSSAPPEAPSPLSQIANTSPKSLLRKTLDLTISVAKTLWGFLWRLPFNLVYYLTHPGEARQRYLEIRKVVTDEIDHYWVGTKLLWADVKTAQNLITKTLQGSSLTRRERKQLLRTVTDLFRVVPFSMFIIIPLGEFALPFALRVFPNLLPSTFQDSLKEEESMKRELQSRIAMAQFFQETLEELAKEQTRKARKRTKELQEAGVEGCETTDKQEDTAASMLEFLESARSGKMLPPDVVIRYANYFQDDLTLDNMPRMQLINMCKYMNIPPYGSDSFLRFQLRYRIRALKEDDQRILWEGIDSLTKMELREACRERGMRSTGLSKEAYKRALQQWLDLSVHKDVPISLLIMSRTFFLREEVFEQQKNDDSSSLAGLADAISGLDKEVVNEVILDVATSEEKRADPDVRKIKLEVVAKQNELIRAEAEALEAAKKREKERAESQIALEETEQAPSTAEDLSAAATKAEAPATVTQVSDDTQVTKEEIERVLEVEEEADLSPHEMDALKQLVSDDPVSRERAELEKIKAAMKSEGNEEVTEGQTGVDLASETKVSDTDSAMTLEATIISSEEADKMVKDTIDEMEKRVEEESSESTHFSSDTIEEAPVAEASVLEEEAEVVDPVVARLKKRLESMVDKIEVQLTETEVKIGDKLHFLDKDRDGILSPEEMAEVLCEVLKRKISFEDALEIAHEMDENKDGVFTVDELLKWIDRNRLVKFVEEGRDADMERILHDRSTPSEQPQSSKDEENPQVPKGTKES